MKFTGKFLSGQSTNASFVSNWIKVESVPVFAVHAHIDSGTPSGSLTFEVSTQDDANTRNVPSGSAELATWITWFVVLDSQPTVTITSGDPSDVICNFRDQGYKWLRMRWTKAPGTQTGTMSAFVTGKGGLD